MSSRLIKLSLLSRSDFAEFCWLLPNENAYELRRALADYRHGERHLFMLMTSPEAILRWRVRGFGDGALSASQELRVVFPMIHHASEIARSSAPAPA